MIHVPNSLGILVAASESAPIRSASQSTDMLTGVVMFMCFCGYLWLLLCSRWTFIIVVLHSHTTSYTVIQTAIDGEWKAQHPFCRSELEYAWHVSPSFGELGKCAGWLVLVMGSYACAFPRASAKALGMHGCMVTRMFISFLNQFRALLNFASPTSQTRSSPRPSVASLTMCELFHVAATIFDRIRL